MTATLLRFITILTNTVGPMVRTSGLSARGRVARSSVAITSTFQHNHNRPEPVSIRRGRLLSPLRNAEAMKNFLSKQAAAFLIYPIALLALGFILSGVTAADSFAANVLITALVVVPLAMLVADAVHRLRMVEVVIGGVIALLITHVIYVVAANHVASPVAGSVNLMDYYRVVPTTSVAADLLGIAVASALWRVALDRLRARRQVR